MVEARCDLSIFFYDASVDQVHGNSVFSFLMMSSYQLKSRLEKTKPL